MGLFILAVTLKIIATVIMLLEVFNCIQPLIVFLQMEQDSLCISHAQTVGGDLTLNLKNALHKKMYFSQEEFVKINLQASEQVLLLCPSTNLRREPFKFSAFRSDTYAKFIATFEEERNNRAFEHMHFWKCFSAFDPRGLPENINEIAGYRNGQLEILIIR